jgi:predicted O-methyltransferase YrrM
MDQQHWSEVDDYLAGLFAPHDAALDEALSASVAAGLPAIAVSPTQGALLGVLARAVGARAILEIGTLGGYSAIWLARALAPGGRLLSLELDPRHAEVARANLSRAGLAGVTEVRVGAALDTLPALAREGAGPFDLVFIDADKANIAEYVDWSVRLARPGALIVVDNVIRDGKVTDPASADASVHGVRRFNERFAADPRVRVTTLQTVGHKGWDGLALAVVVAA